MIYKKEYLKFFSILTIIFLFGSAKVLAFKEYNFGDKIRIRGSNYYVIENSGADTDYIYLMRESILDSDEIYQYAVDESGNRFSKKVFNNYEVSYYENDKCYRDDDNDISDISGCNNNYELSNVKTILNNWKNDIFEENELKEVNGYVVKLLTVDEIIQKFKFEQQTNVSGEIVYKGTNNTPDFLPSRFWLMDPADDLDKIYYVYNKSISESSVTSSLGILPTLYLKKCAIEGTCSDNNYNNYVIGDKVSFRGNSYYVIENSESGQDYVTLVKEKALTINDIQKTSTISYEQGNKIFYDKNDCSSIFYYDFHYIDSNVRDLIDNWVNDNFYDGELKRVNGYKARILSDNDEIYNKADISSGLNDILYKTPMRLNKDFKSSHNCNIYKNVPYEVNPVINLKKCALEGICSTDKKEEYYFGDLVTYKGESYHVLKNSDKYSNYVTLLKDDPLTKNQIMKYKGYGDIEIKQDDNGIGSVAFSNPSSDISYRYSNIKKIVDNWFKDNFSSSVTYNDKYTAKILSTEDLVNYLGYEWGAATAGTGTLYAYKRTDLTPSWFYSKYEHNYVWLMSPYDDSSTSIWTTYNDRTFSLEKSEFAMIRPVINVNKCEINPDADSCLKCQRVTKTSKLNRYKEYSIGEIVNYKGQDFYVMNNSSSNSSYLKLMRKNPLTADQLNLYGKDNNGNTVLNRYTYYNENDISSNKKNGKISTSPYLYEDYNTYMCTNDSDINCNNPNGTLYSSFFYYNVVIPGQSYVYDNGYGGMQFYSDNVCYAFNGTDYNSNHYKSSLQCDEYNNYDNSNIKFVIDNWLKNELDENDLVSINGYKTRLASYSEVHDAIYNINLSDKPKSFMPDDYEYWIMNANTNLFNYIEFYNIDIFGVRYMDNSQKNNKILYPTVRPIIFLNKQNIGNNIALASCYVDEDNEIIPDPIDEPEEPSIIDDPEDPKQPVKDNPKDPITEDSKQPIIEDPKKTTINKPDDVEIIVEEDNEPTIIDAPSTSKFVSLISIVISSGLIAFGLIVFVQNLIKSKKKL